MKYIKDELSIKVEELEPYNTIPGERILSKTKNSSWIYNTDKFVIEYVYFVTETARYLVDKKR